ncbi:MAG: HAMP domain-containing sensor histidine kinase [bacterium]
MRFKSTSIKMTSFYVATIMLVSFIFSIAIYEISLTEINNNLRHQNERLMGFPPGKQIRLDLENARNDLLQDSNSNLRMNLIYYNLVILVLATGVSYLLARRTLKPIEEMFEVQNRFTADASHELRTPLTAMKTEIEVSLRDKEFNITEAKQLLQSNLEEIEKLESLSNGLLTLNQFQDGQQIELTRTSIKVVITETEKKLHRLIQKKEIEVITKIDDSDVMGDKVSLVKLFVTLFDNAIKYSPEKSKIEITSTLRDTFVEIKIKDQGLGIKLSDLPYIFNPFFRADHSRSKFSAEGYGLGLSIAKKIVQAHQGKIEVSSKLNQGTTFIVKLPKFSN